MSGVSVGLSTETPICEWLELEINRPVLVFVPASHEHDGIGYSQPVRLCLFLFLFLFQLHFT
jgi:hypothetical protein